MLLHKTLYGMAYVLGDVTTPYVSGPAVPAGRTGGGFPEESTLKKGRSIHLSGAEKQVEMDPQSLLRSGLPALPVTYISLLLWSCQHHCPLPK